MYSSVIGREREKERSIDLGRKEGEESEWTKRRRRGNDEQVSNKENTSQDPNIQL